MGGAANKGDSPRRKRIREENQEYRGKKKTTNEGTKNLNPKALVPYMLLFV